MTESGRVLELPPNPEGGGCLEIWGADGEREDAIQLAGMQAWIHTVAFGGDEHGGDVLFVSTCQRDHVRRFALADVAGHGATVAKFASELRALMRLHVNEVDQTQFARSLNSDWLLRRGDGVFATAVFVTVLLPERLFVVCNAGHPKPLWYQSQRGAWTFLDAHLGLGAFDNLPLGIINPTRYNQFAVAAAENDLLILYSDAYLESRAAGKPIGERGLLDLTNRLPMDEPRAFGRSLRRAVLENTDAIEDDQSLVVISPHAAPV